MKRILLTGGAGFIGHALVDYLLAYTDHEIVLLDRLDSAGNLNRLHEIDIQGEKRARFVFHDLRASINDQLAKQLGEFDYILHLAAGTHVDRSIHYPMEFVQDNVVATCNLLEYARQAGCEKFIQFSTDEVFGPAAPGVKFKEDDPFNCSNPYSATKAGAEVLALAYWKTYKVPVLVTHTMNVIGIRQHPEKFIPNTIAKLRAGREIIIHCGTDGKPGSRYYIDAHDVSRGVMVLLEAGNVGEKYNIVGQREFSNLEVAEIIAQEMNVEMKYQLVEGARPGNRPGHDIRYALDGTKMEQMFNFQSQVHIQAAIRAITRWSLEHPQWLLS